MNGFEISGGGISFLVRVWREPRAEGDARGPARVYVRHLRSGEERYLKSLEDLTHFLAQRDRNRSGDASGEHRDTEASRRHAG